MSRKNPPGRPPSRRQHSHPEPDDGPPPRRGQLGPRLAGPEFRQQIKSANVVIGVDTVGTGTASMFFGKVTLERHVKAVKALVVTVPVDFATDDVEVLYAFCVTQKGSCWYNGAQTIVPSFN